MANGDLKGEATRLKYARWLLLEGTSNSLNGKVPGFGMMHDDGGS